MEETKLKNIVVLKNLPSNIVEEAIVVLKQNKVKLPDYIPNKDNKPKNKEESRDYILKEAQMVISDYLSTVEKNKSVFSKKNQYEKKYKRLKIFTWCLGIALIVGILI